MNANGAVASGDGSDAGYVTGAEFAVDGGHAA